jgi:hypothetical protein
MDFNWLLFAIPELFSSLHQKWFKIFHPTTCAGHITSQRKGSHMEKMFVRHSDSWISYTQAFALIECGSNSWLLVIG